MDWGKTSVSKEGYYSLLSTIAIKNDSKTLKALVSAFSQPVVSLMSLPYIALFCSSVGEFINHSGITEVQLKNGSPLSISDVRNKLKLFSEKYGQLKNRILKADADQDDAFREKLRFKWLAPLNIHYNLGVFFTSDGKIIGNTQYVYHMFQDRKFSRNRLEGKAVQEFGEVLGTIIQSVCTGLSGFLPEYKTEVFYKRFPIFYKDYNTNRSVNFFPSYEDGKEMSLRILHLVCSVNFIRYILGEIVPWENIWSLRVKYITVYYVYRSLERFQNRYPNEEIRTTLDCNRSIIDSSFRGCMMHYGFTNHGISIIKDEFLGLDKALFGVVESCFDGMTYEQLSKKLDSAINQFSDLLSDMAVIDTSHRKLL